MRHLLLTLLLISACKPDEKLTKELETLKGQLAACESQKASLSAAKAPPEPAIKRPSSAEDAELEQVMAIHAEVEEKLKPAYLPQLAREASAPESLAITANHLDKNVQPHLRKPWQFTGEILHIVERDGRVQALIGIPEQRELVFSVGWYETSFVRGDTVEIVGYIAGTHRFEPQPGQGFRVPVLLTSALLKPGSVRRLARSASE